MPLFAEAANLTPEQIQHLANEAARLKALPPEQVAALPSEQLRQAHQVIEQARWATELPYFRWLHDWLPEPFFQTQGFLLFFLAVAAAYWLIPRRWNTARVWLLVVASFHFYAAWNASLALLVTATATLDYLFARGMDSTDRRGTKRVLMWCSILMNVGVLAYFKYRGFFLDELHDLLAGLGVPPGFSKLSPLNILIPFGISFYTFEAISYAVDVATGKIRAERRL